MEHHEKKFHLHQFKAISHAISTYTDLGLLLIHLAEGTAKTFEAHGCCIMLLDESEKQLFTVSSYGISDDYVRKGPVFVDDRYTALVKGKPVWVKDMQTSEVIQYPEAAKEEGIESMLSIPIRYRDSVLGVIRIYMNDSRGLHEDDIDSLSVLGEQLGLVLEINGLRNILDELKMTINRLPLRLLKGSME